MNHKQKSAADLTALLVVAFIALCLAALTSAGIIITNERYQENKEKIAEHVHSTAEVGKESYKFHILNGDTLYVHVKIDHMIP